MPYPPRASARAAFLILSFSAACAASAAADENSGGGQSVGRVQVFEKELEKERGVPREGAGAALGGRPEGGALSRKEELYNAWAAAYGISDDPRTQSRLPPPEVQLPAGIPWPPHLQECRALEQHRWELEWPESARGGSPAWACVEGEGGSCHSPKPPWVRGEDHENLPMLRRVQRDIWTHQFARDCRDPSTKFLVVSWDDDSHGMGSLIHLMGGYLAHAINAGRVLVELRGSFRKSMHDGCNWSKSAHGSFGCYFFPFTTKECTEEAHKLMDQGWEYVWWRNASHAKTRIAFMPGNNKPWNMPADAWNRPWTEMDSPFEMHGTVKTDFGKELKPMVYTWWRAQATRFLLRWPTAYLCHVTNKVRHESYGMEVAADVASAEAGKRAIEEQRLRLGRPDFMNATLFRDPEGEPLQRRPAWRFAGEPYVPRPIISMHVRQGDKGRERMRLFGLESYMWLAYRVREMVPGIRNIWISTEMQSVINQALEYNDWTFYHINIVRNRGTESPFQSEQKAGSELFVGYLLANLIIGSECDMFVGVLESNWSRLLNELRMTNGRMKSSFMALNFSES